jgi:hypothetical protein
MRGLPFPRVLVVPFVVLVLTLVLLPAADMQSAGIQVLPALVPGGRAPTASFTGTVTAPGSAQFQGTSSMSAAHSQHTATLLATGKVLVVGGGTASADLYDPATGLWAATGSMSVARTRHTATLLGNGKVLLAGGWDSASGSSAELYDPETGLWAPTGSMSTQRGYHSATLLGNGKVLVAGGVNGSVDQASAELYDPLTGLWTPAVSMHGVRSGHTATMLGNGTVLVAGGGNGWGSYIANAELYDPSTGLWSVTGSMNAPRIHYTATRLNDGRVLVAGAWDWTYDRSAELYDPAIGLWTATGSLGSGRGGHTATLLGNGKVLVVGGSTSRTGVELYDPATGSWATIANIGARCFASATLLDNGKLLLAGGEDYSPPFASAELGTYTPGITISATLTLPTDWSTNPIPVQIVGSTTGDGLDAFALSSDGATWGPWIPAIANTPLNTTWDVGATGGNRTVHVRVRDFSGQYAEVVSGTMYDTGAPSGTIIINGGAATTSNPLVTLALSATDALSTVSDMSLSNDGAIWSAWQPYTTSAPWTMTSGNGLKTIYTRFRDAAGNVSANATDTITLEISASTCTTWDLAEDYRAYPDQENPGRDSCGNPGVWHYLYSDVARTTFSPLPTHRTSVEGIAGLELWYRPEEWPPFGLPELGKNASGTDRYIGYVWKANTINAHPYGSKNVVAGWSSPVTGVVSITGAVTDLNSQYGNGVKWYVQKGTTVLASGAIPNGGAQQLSQGTGGASLASVPVTADDFIYLIVDADGDFYCDSTQLDFTITQTGYFNPVAVHIASDATWRVSGTEVSGWQTAEFDDASWESTVAPAPDNCGWANCGQTGFPSLTMWSASPNKTIYLRKTFYLDPQLSVVSGTIKTCSDDNHDLYVNGTLVASDWDGPAGPTLVSDLKPSLRPGTNVIAIKADDTMGGCRWMCVDATIEFAAGPAYSVSGRVANASQTPLAGVRIAANSVPVATTGPDGQYTAALPAGSYAVAPSAPCKVFSPDHSDVTVPPTVTGQDFVANDAGCLFLPGVAREPTRTPTATATSTVTPTPTPIHVDFLDDFSNPASGWFVGDVDNIRYGYYDNEYEILVRPQNTIAFVSAPISSLSAPAGYSVETDVRQVYGMGGYGLVFDRTSASDFYVLSVDLASSSGPYFAVRRHTASGWTFVLGWVQAPAINSGAAPNHLKVTRIGGWLYFYANGQLLTSTGNVAAPSVGVQVGLTASNYGTNALSVQFDNFHVAGIQFGTTGVTAARSPEHQQLEDAVAVPATATPTR